MCMNIVKVINLGVWFSVMSGGVVFFTVPVCCWDLLEGQSLGTWSSVFPCYPAVPLFSPGQWLDISVKIMVFSCTMVSLTLNCKHFCDLTLSGWMVCVSGQHTGFSWCIWCTLVDTTMELNTRQYHFTTFGPSLQVPPAQISWYLTVCWFPVSVFC